MVLVVLRALRTRDHWASAKTGTCSHRNSGETERTGAPPRALAHKVCIGVSTRPEPGQAPRQKVRLSAPIDYLSAGAPRPRRTKARPGESSEKLSSHSHALFWSAGDKAPLGGVGLTPEFD